MNKLDLIIDGNYFLYKVLFVCDKKNSVLNLFEYLMNYYDSLVNIYPFSKIHFVVDGKQSWRYSIYPNYKKGRKKSEKIDWEWVHENFNQFIELLNGKGIKTYQHLNLEGDDWIYLISEKNNNKNISNLIISSDSDLFQLLKMNKNKWINLMWNANWSNEKWFLPQNYFLFFENNNGGNIFINYKSSHFSQFIKKIIKEKKVVLIDYEKELFIKLIKGDKSTDNIPSILLKNGRGLGEKKTEKYYHTYIEKWNEIGDVYSNNFIQKISILLENDIEDNLKLNLRLIFLDIRNYNNDLLKNINEIL